MHDRRRWNALLEYVAEDEEAAEQGDPKPDFNAVEHPRETLIFFPLVFPAFSFFGRGHRFSSAEGLRVQSVGFGTFMLFGGAMRDAPMFSATSLKDTKRCAIACPSHPSLLVSAHPLERRAGKRTARGARIERRRYRLSLRQIAIVARGGETVDAGGRIVAPVEEAVAKQMRRRQDTTPPKENSDPDDADETKKGGKPNC